MTKSELKEIINECIEERFNNIDSITEDTEIVMNEGIFKKVHIPHVDKIREIRNQTPDEFVEDKEIKEYIDKHYDEIMDIAEQLEKGSDDIGKSIIRNTIALIAGIITVPIMVGIPIYIIGFISQVIDCIQIGKLNNNANELAEQGLI